MDWIVFFLFLGLGLCFSLQLAFWLFCFSLVGKTKEGNTIARKTNDKPVSVVICSKNGTQKLKQFLPKILAQSYSDFEVLLMDDGSVDGTESLAQSFAQKHPHFRYQKVLGKPSDAQGKKFALSQGIQEAKNEILLLTDDDCYPSSPFWIQNMANKFLGQKEIVLGVSPYEKSPGLLNVWIRFEAALTFIFYGGFAKVGSPYMGVGRNLMYSKAIFEKANGFKNHLHLTSGDDDLLVNQVAEKENTSFCYSINSLMWSLPETKLKDYLIQKRRHNTTGVKYKKKHQFLLGLQAMSHFGFYFFLISSFFFSGSWMIPAVIYLTRLAFLWLIFAKNVKNLEQKDIIYGFPLLDAVYVLYYVIILPSLVLGNSKYWK